MITQEEIREAEKKYNELDNIASELAAYFQKRREAIINRAIAKIDEEFGPLKAKVDVAATASRNARDDYFRLCLERKSQHQLTPSFSAQELATALHAYECHDNHVDQCDWEYGTWDDLHCAREKYLKKADKILKTKTLQEALELLELMK